MITSWIYHEKKKGKKYWRGEVVLGQDENGKEIRKSFGSYNKAELIKKVKEAEVQYQGVSLNTDFQGTVQDLFKTWMFTFKKPTIQGSSFSKYEQCYRLRLKDTTLGLMDIQKVNKIVVQAFVNKTLENNSEDMTRRTLMHLKSFFKYLVDEGALVRNPCNSVFVKKEIKPDKQYEAYTKEDQLKIIEALDLLDPVDMMIYFGFATGLRLGEIAALTWPDLKDWIVDVNKKYGRVATVEPGKKTVWKFQVGPLKTQASYRQVPLPAKAISVLRNYKINQLRLTMLNLPDYEANNLVFPNEKGKHQNLNRPTRRIESICKKIGVDYISFHATRHSYITRLFENGVDIKTIQKLAGHEDIETTLNVYTHTNKERKAEAVDLLSDVL